MSGASTTTSHASPRVADSPTATPWPPVVAAAPGSAGSGCAGSSLGGVVSAAGGGCAPRSATPIEALRDAPIAIPTAPTISAANATHRYQRAYHGVRFAGAPGAFGAG